MPAAALADGQLDPTFNGTGYHLGSAAEGTIFSNVENRLPMIVQADGKIVMGGSRAGSMVLVRYNVDGSIDPSFGGGGFVLQQFSGTPAGSVGTSGAVAMALDASGNIVVAGFGGSQSEFVARYAAANGAYIASAVCYAPHLIDYTARAVAVRPNGTIVIAGYARDRHPSIAVPGTPAVTYGQHAVLTLPATGNSTTACGTYASSGGLSLGSANVKIDGLGFDGTVLDASLGGRYYDAALALSDNRFILATTSGPDASAWVTRYTTADAVDASFAGGRAVLAATSLHALALAADGTVLAAGESIDAAVAANRQMLVASFGATGALTAFGTGGIARSRVAGGNDTGQAIAVQPGGNILVGGSANLAGKTAFALTRFSGAGVRDDVFGNHGEVATPLGTPAVNGYITGMALTSSFVAVSGRLTDPAGLNATTARYYASGAPPPPPPAPQASTLKVDSITGSSARVTGTVNANGTAASYWLEFGTSTGYGSKTAAQAISGTTNDVDVGVTVTGLAPGTLYHARLVIGNGIATTPGDDITFTTLGTPGSAANGGGAVVKKKARFCKVPKVTGKKINRARAKVLAGGCKTKVVYKKSKKPKGFVLKQSRKAGKKLTYRAVVKLTVAVKHLPKKHK